MSTFLAISGNTAVLASTGFTDLSLLTKYSSSCSLALFWGMAFKADESHDHHPCLAVVLALLCITKSGLRCYQA